VEVANDQHYLHHSLHGVEKVSRNTGVR